METTLVIVKPDGMHRGLAGRILARFEEKGLRLVGLKLMKIPRDVCERHYAAHRGKPFYEGLVRYMTSSPVVVAAVRGRRAVEVVRRMMGATFGWQAEPGTIRGDWAISTSFNLVHGSDSAEAARREVDLFFAPGELHPLDPDALRSVYDPQEEPGGAPSAP